jgi:hypothetical protein
VPISVAADLGRYAKIGGTFALERGTIENRWLVDFEGTGTADASSEQINEVRGNSFGAGVVVRPITGISVGVAYEARSTTTSTCRRASPTRPRTRYIPPPSRQPERWTASLTWRIVRGLTVYGGASMSDFTKFEGLDFPSDRLAQERVASVGLEYRIHGTRFPIRASARFESFRTRCRTARRSRASRSRSGRFAVPHREG